MEQIKNTYDPMQEAADMARTLTILSNYQWIQQEAREAGIDIIPIKGIDLLQTLYADTLDRPVRDIDLLCRNDEELTLLAKRLCVEEYRLEFPFALQPQALAAKKKASLVSCSTTKVNVDLHTAFVTKKFFAQTIGTFNADALARCHDNHMDDTDRWLFLAQHAAFHMFGDYKWVEDLRRLYLRFTEEKKSDLAKKATEYGFRRVMLAAAYHIGKKSPADPHLEESKNTDFIEVKSLLNITSAERRFLRFIAHYARPFSHKAADRFIAAYWEFTFIDRSKDRWKSWLRLMFPSYGVLTNIYRIKHPLAKVLFYPLNIVVSGMTSMLFWTVYAIICRTSSRMFAD